MKTVMERWRYECENSGTDPFRGLRLAGLAGLFAEEDVVVGVRIERRGEILEVNAGVREFLGVAQPTQVVAEEEPVHGGRV
jgi:hypothetical protein